MHNWTFPFLPIDPCLVIFIHLFLFPPPETRHGKQGSSIPAFFSPQKSSQIKQKISQKNARIEAVEAHCRETLHCMSACTRGRTPSHFSFSRLGINERVLLAHTILSSDGVPSAETHAAHRAL